MANKKIIANYGGKLKEMSSSDVIDPAYIPSLDTSKITTGTLPFSRISALPSTLAGYGITNGQILSSDLTAIAGLAGTAGLLKKTGVGTWTLDTNTYITGNQSITLSGDVTGSGTTSIVATLATVNANIGTFNNLTVNAKGLVTAASNVAYLTSYTETDPVATAKTVTLTAGSGISITGAAQTLGSNPAFTIVNTITNTNQLTNGAGFISANQAVTVTATGEATGTSSASGTAPSIALTLSNSAVIGKVLTGLSISGSTITATDSILTAFGKVQNQVNGLVGGMMYVGTWNASTNTPALTSGVGTKGNLYKVSVAGTTTLDGQSQWNVGDQVVFDGTTWDKIDGIASEVLSFNTRVGAVTLTTGDVNAVLATSLGTVTVGTWQGTAIANGFITNALTGKTYNALTLTALTTGFTIAGGTTSKTLTVPLDATVSGTNTGDQTITLTGDITGSGTGSFATTLATVNANIGSFNNFTVNAKGLITAASNVAYLTSETDPVATAKTVTLTAGAGISITGAAQTIGSNPAFTIVNTITNTNQLTNGAGFISAEVDTLASVTARGNTSSQGLNLTNNGNLAASYGIYIKRNTDTAPLGNFIQLQNAAANSSLFLIDVLGNVTGNSFTGSGSGLSGTANSLSIGGNAATVTNGVVTTGSYANPSWITSLTWSKISSTPTTIGGYGITDFNSLGDARWSLLTHNHTLDSLSNVTIASKASGDLLKWSGAAWVNFVPTYISGNQTITLSGDISGSGTTAITATLPTVNSNVGTFNNVTVNGKGLVTAASNIAYLTANQSITISGDGSGTGTTAIAFTLATVNSNTGTFGSASSVPVITVNGKGLITAVSTATITATSVGLGNVINALQVKNMGGALSFASGLLASRPTAGNTGAFYYGTDTGLEYYDNGTVWQNVQGALSGDVTSSINSGVTTIAANAVTLSKFQQIATGSLLGRSTAATGNIEVITVGSGLTLSGGILSSTNSGTVTSFVFTNGGGFTGTVTTSTTTPTLSLTLQNATTSQSGQLTSTDWNTFNNKQAALSGTGFVKISGTTISYDNSTYLTANQSITLSGDVTGTGTTAITTAISAATVTGKLLTGLSISGSTIAATDSILTAFGKLQNQVTGLVGGMTYVGTWNANTNTPTLTSGTGTKGQLYKVSVAGSTTLDGQSQWNVGDQVVFDGTTWDKIDGIASEVLSFNTRVGAITLISGDVTTALGFTPYNATNPSGYISANQTITLSGDFTGSGTTAITGTLATVNSNVGTFGSASVVPVITVNGKGLVTAVSTATITATSVGLGNVINALQVKNMGGALSFASGLLASRPVAGNIGAFYYGTDTGIEYYDNGTTWQIAAAALSGDVTSPVNSNVTTIAANAVTLSKFQQIATGSLLGRSTAATGNVEVITVGSGLTLSGGVLSNSGNVGTVTNFVFTNGGGFTGTVTTSTSTPTLSLTLQNATTTQSGQLTSTDWNTFNNKQAALSGTGFVKISGTTISYDNSTYLTANQSITLSGDVTGTGTTAITTAISAATVTGKLLTGLSISGSTIAATDSILTAFGKLQNQVTGLVGGMTYVGTWNANTNTPTLVSSTGTKGQLYKVSVAGTTTLDGQSQWNVGDQVVFDGTTWDKIDGIASEVLSFNTRVGAITLVSGDVTSALGFTPYNATNPSGYISANQNITLSGDFTGSGTTAITGTLATVNANIGTFNNVTVNAKGLVTAASTVAYLTSFTETDPVANAKTVTLTAGAGISITGAAQTIGSNPAFTIVNTITNTNQLTNGAGFISAEVDTLATVTARGNSSATGLNLTQNGNLATSYGVYIKRNTDTASTGYFAQFQNAAASVTLFSVDTAGNVIGTSFAGAGTGLTGTAASLNIGGNAATVTNGVYTTGSYANPSWLTSLAWSKITSTPTTIGGYGITDFNSLGDARWSLLTHNHTIDSLSNVTITSKATGDLLKWSGAAWVNFAPTYISSNQSITLSGDISGTGTTAITTTIGANAVTLSKFQQIATGSLLGRSTAATGNVEVITVGTGLTLSAGTLSSTNSGTVTNFVFTNGGGFTGTVTTSSSTPTLALTLQNATSLQSGQLTSTDWNTFNNKQAALSGTGFVKISGTTISYDNSTYLTANQSITLSGDVTGTGTTAITTAISAATVTGKLLTGLSISGSTIAATDSILTAFGKLQNQVTGLVGGMTYVGTWNASTNTPALTSGTGTKGQLYKVSVAGSTTLDGQSQWNVGDQVVFDGTTWDKIDGIASEVLSFNTRVGAITLISGDVTTALGFTPYNATNPSGYISANQNITLSGDFTGSGTTAITGTLATVNSNIGTFNNVTVNAKGLVTAASTVAYLTTETDPVATAKTVTLTAGAGISITGAAQTVGSNPAFTIVNTITNTNQLTNGAGFISAEVDTLATVTARGNSSATGLNLTQNGNLTTSYGVYIKRNTDTSSVGYFAQFQNAAASITLFSVDTAGNVTGTSFSGAGTGLTGTATTLNIGGNAATVTNGVYTTGTYSNPAWITALAWGKITSTPTTIGGYGITDFNSLGDARWSLLTHNHTLDSLSNVTITTKATGDLIKWNGSAWINFAPTYISGNQSITLSGDVSGTGTTAITTTIGANAVTLSKFQQIATGTLLGRSTALTGNAEVITVGSGLTLSAGVLSSTNSGTVTNFVFTNGGGFTGTVTTSSSTPTLSLTLQNATTTQSGQLTSTDWNTFNNKQAALSGTGFVKITGTTISYDASTYLTANQNITLSGDVTGSGTTAITTAISAATVTGKLLTGLSISGSTIAATDSILTAFGKLQNQVTGLVGGMTYVGTWNASTNTPALVSSTGTKGQLYKVSVAGSTTLDGQSQWNVGDQVVFDGTTWDKIDGIASEVLSFNTRVGAITLVSGDVTTALGFTPYNATNPSGYISANQNITLSGDFTGSGTTAITGTLATVNSNIGTFNNVTVNAKGLVTAASTVAYLTSFTETDPVANAKTVTLTAGAGISITGAAQTIGVNPAFTIVNTITNTNQLTNGAGFISANQAVTVTATGEATGTSSASGTAPSIALTLSNSAVIGKVLTGLSVAGSTITATDSILTAFGKIQNQVNGLVGGMTYVGTWNASTNTPTLTSSVGTKGQLYKVSVAGSTTLDGQSQWNVGDQVVFDGSTWDKIDGIASEVLSFNTRIGAITLTTADVNAVAATTVGTVTVGTWQGTAIASGFIASALTGKTYNALTLTALTTGFSIAGGTTSKTLTVPLDATVSGTNTGDQTITLTGDITGTGTGSFATTLATVNSNIGTFNNVTVNAKGLVTAASSVAYLTSFTETDPVATAKTVTLTAGAGISITGAAQTIGSNPAFTIVNTITNTNQLTNGAGFISAEVDTLASVTGRGNSSTTGLNLTQNGNLATSYGIYIKRNTDTSSLGYFVQFQNAAANSTLFSVDTAGNVTGSSFSGTGTGLTGTATTLNIGGNAATVTNGVYTTGSYANPSWLTSLAWSKISSTPTTIGGYGITDFNSLGDARWSLLTHNHTLDSLSNVTITTKATGDLLKWSGSAWVNFAPTYISSNQSITLSGDISGTGTTAITTTIGTNAVTLSKFQQIATGSLLGRSTTATGNVEVITVGGGLTLSAGVLSSTNSGTVTNFVFTNGGGFTGTVTTSSSTPTLSLTLQNATTTQSGQLTSTDWNTFNNKQTALSGTGFVKITGTTISYDNSTYLTSNQNITLSGDVTGSGTTAITTAISAATVTGKLLTGLSISGSTIAATDSILTAFGKLQNQVTGLVGGMTYVGTWNANTNTPTLTSSVGTKGQLYKVSVAGSTTLDGQSQWNVGDQVVFDGTTWDKIDGIASEVLSFNTRVGAITLISGDVTTALGFTPYNATNPSGYISANQTITLSGDFTGSGTTAITGTLATVNSNIGTFNNVTVNAKGLVTAASTVAYLTTETDPVATAKTVTLTAGAGISITGAAQTIGSNPAFTIVNTITNTNQLTNGAGFISAEVDTLATVTARGNSSASGLNLTQNGNLATSYGLYVKRNTDTASTGFFAQFQNAAANTTLFSVDTTGNVVGTSFSGAGTGLTGTATTLNIGGNAATVTNGVYTTGSYSNPAWITAIAWSKISSTPTTIGGYGITDFNSLGDARWSLLTHNHTLDSLSNVTITTKATGDLIKWNGSAWVNFAPTYISGNQSITLSGDVAGTGTTAITTTIGTNVVTLSKFQQIATGSLLGRSTAATGNVEVITVGAGLTLSAGTLSSTNSGTVTNFVFTNGGGFTGTVATSSSTPTLSLTLQNATSLQAGQLIAADWNTFNNKQAALSGTGFVKISGTTVSYDNSTYLTANQAVTVTATGEATGTSSSSGTAPSIALTLSNSAVIGKVLTGLSISGSTITATDSILTAFGKVQNQVNSLVGGMMYVGTWNASTNTPALASGVGTKGNLYKVSVAGTTTLDGQSQWNVGDQVVFDGTTWDKIDGIASEVLSFNTRVGAITLTTADVNAVSATSLGIVTVGTWQGTAVADTYIASSANWNTAYSSRLTTVSATNLTGSFAANTLTLSISNANVVSALGFTPYNATNPAGYISAEVDTLATVTARGNSSTTGLNLTQNGNVATSYGIYIKRNTDTASVGYFAQFQNAAASTTLFSVDTLGNVTGTSFAGAGTGLTGTATTLNIGGNAATVTNGVYTTGSYANPSWLTSLAWSKISSTPTTIGGYGITDFNSLGDARWSLLTHNHTVDSLSNVTITSKTTGDLLKWSGSAWVNFAPTYISGNQSITLSGDISGTGTTAITTTIGANAVTLSKFQQIATGSLLGRSTAATGNVEVITVGSGLTLSAGILSSTNSGTVTNFVFTNGGGFTGTVTTSSSTPTLSLTLQNATTSQSGQLTSTDWNTFNNKQAALSGTGFVKISGTTISYDNSTYLTANQSITLSGDVTGTGTTAITTTISSATVTGKLLTGLSISGSTIAATDSILTAFGKLQNQVTGLVGGMTYVGTWNASTNTPTLTSGTGTKGQLYKVSVAGTTTLDGQSQWNVGDQVVFDGTTWDKIDGIASEVLSFNTRVGAITLVSGDVTGALGFTPYNATNPSGYISANQTITLSGDFTGSGTTAITGTLATVNSNIGTFNNVTVNAKGLVTAASTVAYLTTETDPVATAKTVTLTAGAGISITGAAQTIGSNPAFTIVNTITNTNQLTNGAGFISAEVDTLATVTARGNSTAAGLNLTQNGNLATSYGIYIKRNTDTASTGYFVQFQNAAANSTLFSVDTAGNVTGASFSGVGTGLTGTATTLNIGGNAATVTNGVYTTGSYANPSWITGLAWSKISSTPTTIGGYGITDFNSLGDARWSLLTHNHTVDSLSNVTITSKATGDLLKWSGSAWINFAPTYISGNQSITLSGDISGTGTTAITTTIGANTVTLAKFQQIATGTLLGRSTALTGNAEVITVGSGLTLSGGTLSSTNSGTVTNFVFTNGGGFTGTVTTSSSTPTLSLTLQNATTSQSGQLTSTDWNTFNNKQTALSGTGFVKISGTTISYDNSTYLTANQSITLSGDVTGTGTTAITTAISAATVTGKLLTGLSISGSTIAATDSILTAFGKLQNQVTGLVGGMSYIGTWNASTNTPALASGVGTKGNLYKVSVAGTTTLDGQSQWNVGDQVVFDGTTWDKIDGIASEVLSFNTRVGAITLTTADVNAVSATSLGTVTVGTWQATAVADAYIASSTNWNTAYSSRLTTVSATNLTGSFASNTLTLSISNANVVAALGFTPYNATNPAGYISSEVDTLATVTARGNSSATGLNLTQNGNLATSFGVYIKRNTDTSSLGYFVQFQNAAANSTLFSVDTLGNATGTSFSGAGTGLTGTATTLNIGGNAATVTNGVYTTGSYANPAWITGLAWSKISSTPTTIGGYGITDFNSLGDARWSLLTHNHTIDSLSNVTITTKATGDLLKWSGSAWVNFTPTYISGNQSITLSGDVSGTGTTAITTTIGTNAVTFAKFQQVATGVLLGRSTALTGNVETITIGSGLSLSAGVLSSTVTGTVTNFVFTNGGGFTGTVTTSSSTPTLSLALQNATTTQSGQLTSTDWNTFNNKQTALSGTGFVKISGTTISYDNSTYLTANQSITLSGDVTGTGTTAITTAISAATVTGKLLTGLSISGSTIAATDSILTAFGKLQNQVTGLVGGMTYVGTWNASTNTPALASGTGTKGQLYKVSVAGTTTLDGQSQWNVGDQVVFDGTTWDKIDGIASEVLSFNTRVGAITLTTADVNGVLATSLGTVTVGTWQGTAIADTYISSSANWNTAYSSRLTTVSATNLTGSFASNTLTLSISNANVVAALGFTPYNATNPSGYISANQSITLSGDVSGTGTTAITTTIGTNAVTFAKFQQIATGSLLGRSTAATGNVEVISLGSGLTLSGGVLSSSGGSSTIAVNTVTTTASIGTSPAATLCDATTAGFTVTLPTAVGNSGLKHYIKKIDATTNIVTIATTSSQTIDGSSTIQIKVSNQTITLISNGTNWYII